MKKSIGDFAESLILEQVNNVTTGKELPPSQSGKSLAPAGRDISKVSVPSSFMKEILGEQFTPQDAEPAKGMPSLVWVEEEEPEEKPQPVVLTEETGSQLVSLLEEVRDLLKEMTTTGMIGTNFAGSSGDAFKSVEKKYGYKLPKPAKDKKSILKASIKARLKK
jgi:hypothetical protein